MNILSIFGSIFKSIGSGFGNLISGIGGLFTGMQSSLVQIAGIGLALLAILIAIFVGIKMHDHNVSQLALAKSTEKQQDIIINELKIQNEKLDTLNKYQSQLIKSLDEEKLSLAVRDADFSKYIKNPSIIKKNKQASDIFKETFRKLQE